MDHIHALLEQRQNRHRQVRHRRDEATGAQQPLRQPADPHHVSMLLDQPDPRAFVAAERDVQATALRQVILAVSGGDYAPEREDILSLIVAGETGVRTRGGCLFQTLQGRLCVFREAAAIAAPLAAAPGWSGVWDGRFGLRVASGLSPAGGWAIEDHGLMTDDRRLVRAPGAG